MTMLKMLGGDTPTNAGDSLPAGFVQAPDAQPWALPLPAEEPGLADRTIESVAVRIAPVVPAGSTPADEDQVLSVLHAHVGFPAEHVAAETGLPLEACVHAIGRLLLAGRALHGRDRQNRDVYYLAGAKPQAPQAPQARPAAAARATPAPIVFDDPVGELGDRGAELALAVTCGTPDDVERALAAVEAQRGLCRRIAQAMRETADAIDAAEARAAAVETLAVPAEQPQRRRFLSPTL